MFGSLSLLIAALSEAVSPLSGSRAVGYLVVRTREKVATYHSC